MDGPGSGPHPTGLVTETLAAALGTVHRPDPVAPRTGGPAGNARLTAWLGLLLLPLFIAECVTLLDLHGLISVHIVVGTLLVPLVLLKTASTAWRIARYYLGSDVYRQAGPPPLLLRVLGPLVVLTALAVLGSGLALIALGDSTFTPLGAVGGFQLNALDIHKASFVAWLAVTALHALARTVPAVQLVGGSKAHRLTVPGGANRAGLVLLGVIVAIGVALVVLHLSGYWTHGRYR